MHKKRFEQVIRVGQQIVDEERAFDIRTYCMVPGNPECPTVHCIMGWCAVDPWHRAEGLKLISQPSQHLWGRVSFSLFFNGLQGDAAVAKYLDIVQKDAVDLFNNSEIGTTKNFWSAEFWLERIKLYFEKGQIDA